LAGKFGREQSRFCKEFSALILGWGARIRTWEWRNQNPLPYHLATPHQAALSPLRRADHSGGAAGDQRPADRRHCQPENCRAIDSLGAIARFLASG
jgi:hypothetical protein